MGLFVFLLGAVSSLAIAFILLVNFLNKVEETVQKEYDETKKAIEDATKESTPTGTTAASTPGAPTTPAGISVGTSLSTGMKLPIKVEAKGSADVPEWVFGIVRANMLFLFKAEFDVSASGVVCLDGCQVSIVKKNSEQSSPWHKNNPIQVLGERNLLYQSNTLLMFCKSARDAEMWYYAIFNGAHLSSKKDPTFEQRTKKEQNHFRFLHTILKTSSDTKSSSSPAASPSSSPLSSSHSSSSSSSSSASVPTFTRSSSGTSISHTTPPTSPTHHELNSHVHSHLTWLNALLSRMFWNIHDAPDFSAYLTRKFNKKLLKIKKPSILKTVAICNVTFGPNLPMLTSAQLDHLGASGDVMISGELSYHGGFTLTVAIEIALEVMGRSLSVPVTVTAKVTRLHGRAVAVIPAPPSERIWFAFEREPSCDIDVDTAFGNAGKVANIPRVAKIAVNALKTEMLKIIVLPNMEDFQLPKFKGQKGDKGVVNQPAHPPTATTSTPTSSIPPSSIPSSTPLPTPSSTPLSTHSQAVPTPSLTKGGSPSTSVNQFDHKMIDEALEKLASKAHP